MSAEDLERYEADIELQLYKEYKDVSPMFSYVVETERRFYLANEVNQTVRDAGGRTYVELELARRLGVGHVPHQPLRAERADRHVQGREHRGAPSQRASRSPVAPAGKGRQRQRLGARGEQLVAEWYAARGYRIVARNWRCREGEIDLVVWSGAVTWCSAR